MEVIVPQVISNVPAFLTKLWKMVDDPETSHLIAWGDEGNSFVIHNQSEFSASLLPYYYKHSNMASFVRQLNMYGFHKVVGVESGGLKSEKVEEMEFAHPCFLRGHEHLLESIKRKASNKSNVSYSGVGSGGGFVPALQDDRVNEVLSEVSLLKTKQVDMDGKLDTMKKENEALWREVVSLRQKHLSQQKIVNKLIQFLVSLVQPRMTSTGGAVKRRYTPQLAIEGSGLSREAKEQKRDLLATALNSGLDFPSAGTSGGNDTTATFTLGPDNTITSGPIIHDVTHDIGDEKRFAVQSMTPTMVEHPKTPKTPQPTLQLLAVDPKVVSPAVTVNQPQQSPLQLTSNESSSATKPSPKRPTLHREVSREDMDFDINTVQKDLDNLKDMLSGQITVDSSLISNLFNPEEPLSSVFSTPSGAFDDLSSGITINANKLPIDMDSGKKDGTLGAMSPGASGSTLDEIPLSLTPQTEAGLMMENLDIPLHNTLQESSSEFRKAKPKIQLDLIPSPNQDDILNTPVVYGDIVDG